MPCVCGQKRCPGGFDLHSMTAQFDGRMELEHAIDQAGTAELSTSITVRNIDPGDKSRLRHEARRVGVSMEELVHRLIHEKRTGAECRPKPSEAFARHFGERNGIDLPPPVRCGHRPLLFPREEEE